MWGTPQRSRRDLDRPLEPGSRSVAAGSRQRPRANSWYQRPAVALPREPPDRRARQRCALSHCPDVHAATLGNHHVVGFVAHIPTDPSAGGAGRPGLVANAVREPALGLELLQVGLHHQRRGRAQLGRDVVPGRVEQRRPRSARRARGRRAGGARASSRCSTYSAELRRRVGDPGAVAGADQLESARLEPAQRVHVGASEPPSGGTKVEPSPRTRSPLKQTPVRSGSRRGRRRGRGWRGRAGRRAPPRPAPASSTRPRRVRASARAARRRVVAVASG